METITFTVSTSNGADRHDENFYDTLHNRVTAAKNVKVTDIGGGSGFGGSDFDFEATGNREDIEGLLSLLRYHYEEVREWEE